ncbi:MAG TPA: hypothetical protein VM888_10690 [Chitinophagaceae bacterium]|nr:hypothetical protein [Chitinophagaceae bacterium]
MEMRYFTNTLVGAILLTACTKADLISQAIDTNNKSSEIQTSITASMPFASTWEEPAAWKTKDSANYRTYTCQRSMPELTDGIVKNGVVMVWAKNLVDPTLGMIEKPMLTPFYFFPDNERPKYTEYWYTTPQAGAVSLSFRTNESLTEGTQIPNNKVRLRYILIPQEVLKKNNQTATSVYKLTYTQLTSILGIGQ